MREGEREEAFGLEGGGGHIDLDRRVKGTKNSEQGRVKQPHSL